MELQLREYKKEDFNALVNIIKETWNYDKFSSPKIASKLAKVFFNSCLTNYTYSKVALIDEKVVGIILANNIKKHKCPISNRLKQLQSILSLYIFKEGRKVSNIFKSVNGIDKQLLNDCNKSYPAELALFAISPSYRGKGIGKVLFQSAIDYLKSEGINEFYLFTDTSCNYGFYEHQGMVRRSEKEHIFNIKGQMAKMDFFIYDYNFN